MRGRRLLLQMAGAVPSPHERALRRVERRQERAERQTQATVLLVEQITRRERGEEGAKPMPLARMIERVKNQMVKP
jgi:hypothetical protein